ncbi:hypothetical protein Pr1d_50640 [Bythopirellula goksoeyrii]|uniref:Transmembrane protein n=1 Tax=Bythopirellula goksoeyrii TaxID=1400387 RepID=A0A5B9QFC5_9BACT|nr:hypothetical protein Pr1d_50640 [Bythopirellula goksoeyrii]
MTTKSDSSRTSSSRQTASVSNSMNQDPLNACPVEPVTRREGTATTSSTLETKRRDTPTAKQTTKKRKRSNSATKSTLNTVPTSPLPLAPVKELSICKVAWNKMENSETSPTFETWLFVIHASIQAMVLPRAWPFENIWVLIGTVLLVMLLTCMPVYYVLRVVEEYVARRRRRRQN